MVGEEVVRWLSVPTVTDWLNVFIVLALLIVTLKYARTTDRIMRANQELLKATQGILAETGRQADAAHRTVQIATEQWLQSRRDVVVAIQTALNECLRQVDGIESRLERVLETGADDVGVIGAFHLPKPLVHAVEQARHISTALHDFICRAEESFQVAANLLRRHAGSGSLSDVREAKAATTQARKHFMAAIEVADEVLRRYREERSSLTESA